MTRQRERQPTFDELIDHSEQFYKSLNKEDDVSLVVTSVAFLDQCVASLLEQYFVAGETAKSMLSHTGPLGNFVHRVNLAYCVGLISKVVAQNLRTFAEIRNQFAHKHLKIDFLDDKVTKLCQSLTFPLVRGRCIDPSTGEFKDSDEWPPVFSDSPKARFICIASLAASHLIGRGYTLSVRCQPFLSYWDTDKLHTGDSDNGRRD